jgi:hypothetical protein
MALYCSGQQAIKPQQSLLWHLTALAVTYLPLGRILLPRPVANAMLQSVDHERHVISITNPLLYSNAEAGASEDSMAYTLVLSRKLTCVPQAQDLLIVDPSTKANKPVHHYLAASPLV